MKTLKKVLWWFFFFTSRGIPNKIWGHKKQIQLYFLSPPYCHIWDFKAPVSRFTVPIPPSTVWQHPPAQHCTKPPCAGLRVLQSAWESCLHQFCPAWVKDTSGDQARGQGREASACWAKHTHSFQKQQPNGPWGHWVPAMFTRSNAPITF